MSDQSVHQIYSKRHLDRTFFEAYAGSEFPKPAVVSSFLDLAWPDGKAITGITNLSAPCARYTAKVSKQQEAKKIAERMEQLLNARRHDEVHPYFRVNTHRIPNGYNRQSYLWAGTWKVEVLIPLQFVKSEGDDE